MNKIVVANELVKVAKLLLAIEDYEYVYDPRHKKKPHGDNWVKTDKGWAKGKEKSPAKQVLVPSVSVKPAPVKHDFSPEAFYLQRPKLKDALEKAKKAVSEAKKLETEADEKGKKRNEIHSLVSQRISEILSNHNVQKYNDLPADTQKEVDKLWEPSHKILEEENKLREEIKHKIDEISKLMEDTEIPDAKKPFSTKYGYPSIQGIEEALDKLDLMHHGSEINKKYEAAPFAKHEEVQVGDHLMTRGQIYRVDKKTPSGQLKLTNLHSGEQIIETSKSWPKGKDFSLLRQQKPQYKKIDPETAEYTKGLLEEMNRRQGVKKEASMKRTKIAQELLTVAKSLIATKTYKVWKNGLQINAPDAEYDKVMDDLEEINRKVNPTDDWDYINEKNGIHEWRWVGLFGATNLVVAELKKRGYKKGN